jgi:hypothetical protein
MLEFRNNWQKCKHSIGQIPNVVAQKCWVRWPDKSPLAAPFFHNRCLSRVPCGLCATGLLIFTVVHKTATTLYCFYNFGCINAIAGGCDWPCCRPCFCVDYALFVASVAWNMLLLWLPLWPGLCGVSMVWTISRERARYRERDKTYCFCNCVSGLKNLI